MTNTEVTDRDVLLKSEQSMIALKAEFYDFLADNGIVVAGDPTRGRIYLIRDGVAVGIDDLPNISEFKDYK